MITGSYQQTEDTHTYMQPLCPNLQIEPLRREQSSSSLRGIRRRQISGIKDTQIKGIFAPLMALERCYNILNQYDHAAAFGAAIFLNRPMPVPEDWHSTVQQLNAWVLKHEKDSRLFTNDNASPTLLTAADAFYLYATTKMRKLSKTARSFHTMTNANGIARALEIALIHHPQVEANALVYFIHQLREQWLYFANAVSLPLPMLFAIKAKEYAVNVKDTSDLESEVDKE